MHSRVQLSFFLYLRTMKRLLFLFFPLAFLTACQETLEERAAREAVKYTQKNCPARIDEYTMMDSMTFDKPTHTLSYYYRLQGAADRDGIETGEIRAALLQQVKNATHLRAYQEAGYRFRYVYRSAQSPDVTRFDITFSAADYQRPGKRQ